MNKHDRSGNCPLRGTYRDAEVPRRVSEFFEKEAREQAAMTQATIDRNEARKSTYRLTMTPKFGGAPVIVTARGYNLDVQDGCTKVMDGWEIVASACGDVAVEKVK